MIRRVEVHWYKAPNENIWGTSDIPSIGKYVVFKSPAGSWVAIRNGEQTTLREDSLEQIKKAVENVIKAVMI